MKVKSFKNALLKRKYYAVNECGVRITENFDSRTDAIRAAQGGSLNLSQQSALERGLSQQPTPNYGGAK